MHIYDLPAHQNCFLVEAPINPCGPNCCQNEAACSIEGASYICLCEAGFYGNLCQNGKWRQLAWLRQLAWFMQCKLQASDDIFNQMPAWNDAHDVIYLFCRLLLSGSLSPQRWLHSSRQWLHLLLWRRLRWIWLWNRCVTNAMWNKSQKCIIVIIIFEYLWSIVHTDSANKWLQKTKAFISLSSSVS